MNIPIYIDPLTRQRIPYQEGTTDIEYLADGTYGGSAVALETLPVIGPWTDYTGSGGNYSEQQQMWGGAENIFFGQDIQFEAGANLDNLGDVGERTGTTRRRIKKIHVDLKK